MLVSPTSLRRAAHMSALSESITHPLTDIRLRRGWSMEKVAKIVQLRSGVNMGGGRVKVYKWESGRNAPEKVAQYALADELEVPHDVVDANPWPKWLLTVDAEEPLDAPWTAAAASDAIDSVVSSALMDRRVFIGATASALYAMTEGWAGALASPVAGNGHGVVTHEAVDHLQGRVENLSRLDDALGGGGCLEAGFADLKLVNRLLRTRSFDAEVGQRLMRVSGSLSRFCGWAAFDDGRIAAAVRFWNAGMRGVTAAGDPNGEAVYALSNLALAHIYAGDGEAALNFLARARGQVAPRQRTVLSMLDCWSSRAHALRGDARAAAAVLNRADDLYEDRDADEDPPWIYWMPRPSMTAEAATALMDVGDLGAAERNLREGLATEGGCPGARDRALYLAQLGNTLYRSGRLDEAASVTHDAVDLVAGISSARVRGRVVDVIDMIPRQEPARAELVDHRANAWGDV